MDFDRCAVLSSHLAPGVPCPSFTVPRILTNPGDASQHLLDDSKAKVRHTDWFQVLSWSPRPVSGDDAGKVASRICRPWHANCLQDKAEFANHLDLRRRFHVVTAHLCCLPEQRQLCCRNFDDPVLLPAEGHSGWRLEGMPVKEWPRRPVHHVLEYFTVIISIIIMTIMIIIIISTLTTSALSGGPGASTCCSCYDVFAPRRAFSSSQATSTRVFKGAKVEKTHRWKLLLPALVCRGLRLSTVTFEDHEVWTGLNAVAVSRCHTPTVSGTLKAWCLRFRSHQS